MRPQEFLHTAQERLVSRAAIAIMASIAIATGVGLVKAGYDRDAAALEQPAVDPYISAAPTALPHPSSERFKSPSTPIDFDKLPEQLPNAVRAAIPGVVRIVSQTPDRIESGSGVYVGHNQILTASHVVTDAMPVRRMAACGELEIESGAKKGGSAIADDIVRVDKTRNHDVALALLGLTDRQEQRLGLSGHAIKIRDTQRKPIQASEPVYVIGWSPTDKFNFHRTPNERTLRPLKGETAAHGYNEPHITGGFVVPSDATYQAQGPFATLQGVRNYSKLPDTNKSTEGGDSGGAVVDSRGELLAIHVTGSSFSPEALSEPLNNALMTEGVYPIAPSNIPPNYVPELAFETYEHPRTVAMLKTNPILPCHQRRTGRV